MRRPSSPPDGDGWLIGFARRPLSFLRSARPTGALLGPGKRPVGHDSSEDAAAAKERRRAYKRDFMRKKRLAKLGGALPSC
jgi:hypothetical protein